MKSTLLNSMSALSLVAALAIPIRLGAQPQPPRYTVTDLGPIGNPFSQATFVNNHGLVTGFDTAPDGTSHAVVWHNGLMTDISKPGLGGPNSGAFGVNAFGQVGGGAETSHKDPNNENFCGSGTGLQCLAFVWRFGVMTPLQPLGGTNSGFGAINNLGEVAGFAETSHRDPDCRPGVAVNGTGPQHLDFEAVIWGPRPGEIRELPPLHGDTVGMAFGINDLGQAVGTSGTCGNTVLPGFAAGPHAVLWESDGSVHDLGNLGGRVNTALGVGNVAFTINNRGQVTGVSALPGNTTTHAFLWTKETGMRDLGTLPGDVGSAGLDNNNRGEVVGGSWSAAGPINGTRPFLWRNGVMRDLNKLVPSGSPLHLLVAFGINDVGQIAGFGMVTTGASAGEVHGFLATPGDSEDDRESSVGAPGGTRESEQVTLPERARFGRFRPQLVNPR